MDETILDITKIPKLQFQIHNQELTNCIKELYFQFKTTEKKMDKQKKDIEMRVTELTLSDLFVEVNSAIDIDAALLKFIPAKAEGKYEENQLKGSFNKFGRKIGQVGDVMKFLYDKISVLEKRIQSSDNDNKKNLNEKTQTLQGQLDDFMKSQKKQNRTLNENLTLNQNKYEQKLKQVQSQTLWQINDCNTKLNDRVNGQFVKDAIKQTQTKIMNRMREANNKNNIDPSLIDGLTSQCNKLEKALEIRVIEINARIQELKDNVLMALPSKHQINSEKIENQKRFGNLHVVVAQYGRKIKNLEGSLVQSQESIKMMGKDKQALNKQIQKMAKLIQNLKLGDDFMKLMATLDPHKLCAIDDSIKFLTEQDLKIQKDIQSMKRYTEKFREKMQICNLLIPNDQSGGKLNKEELNKALQEIIATNATFKKIGVIQGQMYEFKTYGQTMGEMNKRIAKIQKDFDIQSVIYGLRAVQEYIKKEMLIMNTRMTQLEGQFNEFKRKRPLSANKSQTRMTSSISYKKLLPVDCISCFQNPMEKTPDRIQFLSKKY